MNVRVTDLAVVRKELQAHIRRNELFPMIGSGFTKGCRTTSGATVPSGQDMQEYMTSYLSAQGHEVPAGKSFSQIAQYYFKFASEEDINQYFREHFLGVQFSPKQRAFLNLNWRFIYTLNLDDGIERNSQFRFKILPFHQLAASMPNDEKCVYKLHGDVEELIKYKDARRVLSTSEYVLSLSENKDLLGRLQEALNYSNTIFIGCSLSDELDLLSVAHELNGEVLTQRNRYYVTDHTPNDLERSDLEDYGIDTVIVVEDYSQFYQDFIDLSHECSFVQEDEMRQFCNLSCATAHPNDNINYMLFGKYLFERKKDTIFFPDYFITRDITRDILEDMPQAHIQIICGPRISGKSYLLADLAKCIRNRDTYYFDSRNHVNEDLLKSLLSRRDSVVLFDTNVLSAGAIKYLLGNTDSSQIIKQNSINVVICINSSDREVLALVGMHPNRTKGFIRDYRLANQFSYDKDGEFERVNAKIRKAGNVIQFSKNCTILDSLISIQRTLRARGQTKFDPMVEIAPGDVGKVGLLILLALNEKVTANEIVKCGLMKESSDLLKEISLTVEEDHRNLLMLGVADSTNYQIVCTAKIWLLKQMLDIGLDTNMHETIVSAFQRIVQSFLGQTKRFKLIEDLTKFDKINEIFPGEDTLIVKIYEGLRPILMNSYQYFHQYAKCHMWKINSEDYAIDELENARQAAITAKQMAQDAMDNAPGAINHQVAYAHILYTLTILQVKMCFLEDFSDPETISETVVCFRDAIQCPANEGAMSTAKNSEYEDAGIIKAWISRVCSEEVPIHQQSRKILNDIIIRWRALS